jgi:hypothetical protein
MVERWGRWVVGWRWALDEGDFGGGPIHAWCCPRDSITSAEETLARVGAALIEWRGWLEELAERIASVEHARDPLRARGLRAVYGQVRADAQAGAALDFALLATWQQLVLGTASAPFRTGPAFAKAGGERHGLTADTENRFEALLAQSREAGLPVAARAARVYLDVCFVHPFADGNARSALLALAFLLAVDGIVLDQIGPIAQVLRFADDTCGAQALADTVTVLIEGTRRRATAEPHGAAPRR